MDRHLEYFILRHLAQDPGLRGKQFVWTPPPPPYSGRLTLPKKNKNNDILRCFSPLRKSQKKRLIFTEIVFYRPSFFCLVSLESRPGCLDWSDCARKMLKSCSLECQKLAKNCQKYKNVATQISKVAT